MNSVEERIQRLEDLEAIRYLSAQYCRRLDDGDWDGVVDLFTEDGQFDGLSHSRGRSAMRESFAALAEGGLTSFWHFITNVEIDLDGDRATVRSFLWMPCVNDGAASVGAGRYTDEVRKVDGRWRYETMQVRFNFFGPLVDGWDENQFATESARRAAVHP
ncbi:MAG TPA: nuclear transport factor 2 family protein [Aldersonia sp.]